MMCDYVRRRTGCFITWLAKSNSWEHLAPSHSFLFILRKQASPCYKARTEKLVQTVFSATASKHSKKGIAAKRIPYAFLYSTAWVANSHCDT